jgi:acetoin utilization deacetylase AcuC-like enzyme
MLVFHHPSGRDHDTGRGHPERPARLEAVSRALDSLPGIERRVAPAATREQLGRIHDADYVEAVLAAVPESGYARLDPDTVVSPASGMAALHAAGAVVAAVDAVLGGKTRAFCAVRPPGHHAEPDRAMGFCLFNNIAVGVAHARQAQGVGRIAIVDFDVHHGNGTQAAFWSDRDTLFVSIHQWPLYPGTGSTEERGAHGNVVNCPVSPGTGSAGWREVVEARVLPQVDAFAPEMIFVSAGFDAHARDPLASLRLEAEDFAWITAELVRLAEQHAGGRLVSSLEGGYDLEALEASVRAHLQALAG